MKTQPRILTAALLSALAAIATAGCWEQITVNPVGGGVLQDRHWATPLERAIQEVGGDEVEKSVICIDTSGSISDLDITLFIQHINTTMEVSKEKPTILIGDTEVDWEGTYEGPETLAEGTPALNAAAWKGRGGTDFRGLIVRAIELDPEVIIYLTDGYGILPEIIPEQEIIWLVNVPCYTVTYQKYNPQAGTSEDVEIEVDRRCKELKEFGPVISIVAP